jgi:hypothetical protein
MLNVDSFYSHHLGKSGTGTTTRYWYVDVDIMLCATTQLNQNLFLIGIAVRPVAAGPVKEVLRLPLTAVLLTESLSLARM